MKVYVKSDRDRRSNIPERNKAHRNGIALNDIAKAFSGTSDVQRVPVSYSENDLFNRPSVAIEEIPTDYSEADSELQDTLTSIKGKIAELENKSKGKVLKTKGNNNSKEEII